MYRNTRHHSKLTDILSGIYVESWVSIHTNTTYFLFGFTSHKHSISHMGTFQFFWWKKTSGALLCVISGSTATWVEPWTFHTQAGLLPQMKKSKVPVGIEPSAVTDKWIQRPEPFGHGLFMNYTIKVIWQLSSFTS
jgi:hypothetical protein